MSHTLEDSLKEVSSSILFSLTSLLEGSGGLDPQQRLLFGGEVEAIETQV